MASKEQASGKAKADDDDAEASSDTLVDSVQLVASQAPGETVNQGDIPATEDAEKSTTGAKSNSVENTVICYLTMNLNASQ